MKVPLIDMHKKTEALLIEKGEEASKSLFLIVEKGVSENYPDGRNDNTHFSPLGARMVAALVVKEIKAQNIYIRKFLTDFEK